MLVVAALAFSTLCVWQFRRDNAAPHVDVRHLVPAAAGRDALAVDRCERSARKLIVQGWLVSPGQERQARRMRVLVSVQGRWRALDTRLHDRDDVAGRAAAVAGVDGYYRHAGFEAALDLDRAGLDGPIEAVAIARDDGTSSALIVLPCPGVVP